MDFIFIDLFPLIFFMDFFRGSHSRVLAVTARVELPEYMMGFLITKYFQL